MDRYRLPLIHLILTMEYTGNKAKRYACASVKERAKIVLVDLEALDLPFPKHKGRTITSVSSVTARVFWRPSKDSEVHREILSRSRLIVDGGDITTSECRLRGIERLALSERATSETTISPSELVHWRTRQALDWAEWFSISTREFQPLLSKWKCETTDSEEVLNELLQGSPGSVSSRPPPGEHPFKSSSAQDLMNRLSDTRKSLSKHMTQEQAILYKLGDFKATIPDLFTDVNGKLNCLVYQMLNIESQWETSRRLSCEEAMKDVEQTCPPPFYCPTLLETFVVISKHTGK